MDNPGKTMSKVVGGKPSPATRKQPRRSEMIAAQIETAIRAGEFQPGGQLSSERDLAEHFKVARPTIRAAIQQLELGGLVTVSATRGTFVRDLAATVDELPPKLQNDLESLIQIVDLRIGLEGWVSSEAALRASPQQIREIDQIVRKLETLQAKGQSISDTDLAFHQAVARATHNPVVLHILQSLTSLRTSLQVFQSAASWIDAAAGFVLSSRQVADAIARRDPESAKQAMVEHLQVARKALLRIGQAQLQTHRPLVSSATTAKTPKT